MVTLRCIRPHFKALALTVAAGFLALALPVGAQTFSRGVPASVSSPESDGRQHGIPASVVSPVPDQVGIHGQRPAFHSRGPLRRFGSPHDPRHRVFVPVPLFYPVYYGEGNVADPYVPAQTDPAANADQAQNTESNDAARASEDELRQAYLQGAREALAQERAANRNGRQPAPADERRVARAQASDDVPRRSHVEEPAAPQKEDDSPATVFIFKDGHKLETRNFAIMGTTLYDLSGSVVRKVSLVDVDKAATLKENDSRGIQVKLP